MAYVVNVLSRDNSVSGAVLALAFLCYNEDWKNAGRTHLKKVYNMLYDLMILNKLY